MTTLDSVIAQHWANLIPAPAPADPMHVAMDDYIAGQRVADRSTATSSRPPSPTAAGNGGGR